MTEVLDTRGEARDTAVERAAELLRSGEVVVLPTDTVYGVAADAFSHAGTARLFTVKDRSRAYPLPVLVRSHKQLPALVSAVPTAAERLVAAYWPGPLTLVVRAEPNLTWDLGESEGTVAVRMPLDEVALAVARAVGPLAVTSANRSGQPAATDVDAAQNELGEAVPLYLDDGPRTTLRPSTIVDLTRSEPHVLREGSLASDEVLAVARGELDPDEVATSPEDGGHDLDGEPVDQGGAAGDGDDGAS